MVKSPLFGRRIHIAGSIPEDPSFASNADVLQARELVVELVKDLMRRGATFVVPVDAEKVRLADGLPLTFDWLIWHTISTHLTRRPLGAPTPLAVAVQHHKTERQVPEEFHTLWDDLRSSDLVQIENASHWNMNSKRMEAQARWGDILIALGGGEGVLFLANLYHDAGKPVVPLNSPICPSATGAMHLYQYGVTGANATRLFKSGGVGSHTLLNRIGYVARASSSSRVSLIADLLENLEPPRAFAVRLLNDKHPEYADVQTYFDVVVKPVIEDELGYKLVVVDGVQPYESPRIDAEIFEKLHRSSIAVVDVTGARPNCFIELGYAMGRSIPTMIMCKQGSETPFDITTVSALHWTNEGSVDERRRLFRQHWTAVRGRPPLVPVEPLIP